MPDLKPPCVYCVVLETPDGKQRLQRCQQCLKTDESDLKPDDSLGRQLEDFHDALHDLAAEIEKVTGPRLIRVAMVFSRFLTACHCGILGHDFHASLDPRLRIFAALECRRCGVPRA